MSISGVTVLYYTANVERPEFEQRIRDTLLANKGDLPLVSVSQKPLPGFGRNICVGEHDTCYANEFRQIEIGLLSIDTPWVITAEADCLYPPDYFRFQPRGAERCYRYDNVWVLYANRYGPGPFRFKGFSDGVQIMDRKLWLENIEQALSGRPMWSAKDDPLPGRAQAATNKRHTWGGAPVVTFKTDRGVRDTTYTPKGVEPRDELPVWGKAAELSERMFR